MIKLLPLILFLFHLKNAGNYVEMTCLMDMFGLKMQIPLQKDEATEILSQISEETGLNNWTVSSYYDYVNTTLSFSNYAVYGVVAAILFLAAALVIYSIFYISVGQKVAEFGQLRTIGASKKQIYKIVLKQGYMLAVPGILIGSIMGTIISYCLQSKGWSVFAFIVSLCGACLFGILLVYISVRKPAKIAANTSPISALKNPVGIVNYRTHKRHRITPVYLAKISFSRNRKKISIDHFIIGTVRSYIFPCSKLSEFF